ncbi:hypothetical protein B566_EDAN004196 [Ephemera danica]|nr:hypothetical protein B566_EDAN004196 [Ephemera danica]
MSSASMTGGATCSSSSPDLPRHQRPPPPPRAPNFTPCPLTRASPYPRLPPNEYSTISDFPRQFYPYPSHPHPTYRLDTEPPPPPTPEFHHDYRTYLPLRGSSPGADQGYHTLVAPSPQASWGAPYSESPFDLVPDDVVKHIIYLRNSSICVIVQHIRYVYRWHTLAWEPRLWRSVAVSGGDRPLKGLLRRLAGEDALCTAVERVALSGPGLTDRSLLLLARKCPRLSHLRVVGGCGLQVSITNAGVVELVTRCPALLHLDLAGCSSVTCMSLSTDVPTRQLSLQYLDLTDCVGLGDLGLQTVVQTCPQLCFLYLRRCVLLTVKICNNAAQVSDAGIKQVARHCHRLRYLNCRGCEAVGDVSVAALARSCPRLRALDLGKCDITDHALRLLARSCPNLKKLSVKSCELVTDEGVRQVAFYCRGLQQLNIQDCQGVSLEGYRAVKKYCKRCVIEHTNPGFC